MSEEDMEKKIEFLANTTLGVLKHVFHENSLNDREATLSLMYFIEVFVRLGWKGIEPISVLENVIEVIKKQQEMNK